MTERERVIVEMRQSALTELLSMEQSLLAASRHLAAADAAMREEPDAEPPRDQSSPSDRSVIAGM